MLSQIAFLMKLNEFFLIACSRGKTPRVKNIGVLAFFGCRKMNIIEFDDYSEIEEINNIMFPHSNNFAVMISEKLRQIEVKNLKLTISKLQNYNKNK